MTVRKSEATWQGTLREGKGSMKLGSLAFEGPYTWASRFDVGEGTNPEELIGAAHAGCYSMFLSALLTKAGFTPTSIHTTANVHLEAGPSITKIELHTHAVVPGIDEAAFLQHAQEAKNNCPVSKALASVEIVLNAQLAS
jgi:lipoyl-dependent peroxiredoxin